MIDVGTDLLRAFVAVAESLNFTRASEMLHKTQSAVSQQIKRLESELGVPLFDRAGRSVRLTTQGESFLPYARRVLKAHDEAIATITDPDMTGLVRVGISDELSMCYFPEVLKRFAQYHPCVQVEVHCGFGAMLAKKLAMGELDLFINTSARIIPGGEIFAYTPLLWVGSCGHFAHKDNPLPLAMFLPGCSYLAYASEALHQAGRSFRVAYSSPSLAGIHAALASGMAISALITPSIPRGVVVLGSEDGLPPLPLVNVHMVRGRSVTRPADCFANIVRNVIQNGEAMRPAEPGEPSLMPWKEYLDGIGASA